jgi:hypothetical protein
LPVGQWHEDDYGEPYPGTGPPAGGYDDEAGGYLPGPDAEEADETEDPLSADYGGEAEQGYLPGPPTETFAPVPPGRSQARREAPDHPRYGPAEDPATTQSMPYPDQAAAGDREYRASHGRY